jgi:hypothetical protein
MEASSRVGGRVRTVAHEGPRGRYLLDAGFQVLLTAYPEAKALLDMDALKLCPFYAGADVHAGGERHRVAHPWRHPLDAARAFLSPVATLGDKARLAELCATSRLASVDSIFERPETTALERLTGMGFSPTIIDAFFRPFFGGVFLERELATSSRMFDFVYKMFLTGDTAVPRFGMGEIPAQLAAGLPAGSVRTSCPATRVLPSKEDPLVVSPGGGAERGRAVVVATDADAVTPLLGDRSPRSAMRWLGTATLWFSTGGEPAETEAILALNADGPGAGPVNHAVVMSRASDAYAPPGDGLVAASTIGVPDADDAALVAAARAQLEGWYGPSVRGWELLRIDRVRRALPDARVNGHGVAVPAAPRPARAAPGVYVCGDHWANGSIDGALRSGRLAAEAVLADFAAPPVDPPA